MGSARRTLGLAGALVTALLAAAPAGAATQLFPVASDRGERSPVPALPGDGSVVWVAPRDGAAELWRADPGGTPRLVAALPPTPRPLRQVTTFELTVRASPGGVAIRRFAQRCTDCRYGVYETVFDDLVAGPADGPLSTVRCGRRPAALAGGLLAYARVCPGAGDRSFALAPVGAEPTGTLPGEPVDGAGQWLLLDVGEGDDGSDTLALLDLTTGGEALRVQRAGEAEARVAGDGTVAYVDPALRSSRLMTAAPGQAPREVLRAPAFRLAAVAGGRALLLGSDEAILQPLDGSAPERTKLPHARGAVAWDGARLAYAVRACGLAGVVVREPSDPSPAVLDGPCSAAAPVGTASLTRRRLTLELTCPAEPLIGCVGDAGGVLQSRRLGPGSRGQFDAGVSRYLIPAGATRRVAIELPPDARRFARRFEVPRVAVTSRAGGDEGALAGAPLRATLPATRRGRARPAPRRP